MAEWLAFGEALWKYAVLLLTGSVVLALVGLGERLWKKQVHLQLYLGILTALLFYACFQAWRDVYRDAVALQSKLNASDSLLVVTTRTADSLRLETARMDDALKAQARKKRYLSEPPIVAATDVEVVIDDVAPSQPEAFPYEKAVTLQVRRPFPPPFRAIFECDQPVRVVGGSALLSEFTISRGQMLSDLRKCWMTITEGTISPQIPITINLGAKEAFRVEKVTCGSGGFPPMSVPAPPSP